MYHRFFTSSMIRFYQNADADHDLYYSSYVDTYLQIDIRAIPHRAKSMNYDKIGL